mmetsp:Transcript_64681/g.152044  ORF Transcript_64681/g.152044 Transcript_64681/m.152044 type:complete len:490 (-) Transcript_64681:7-1476(-)
MRAAIAAHVLLCATEVEAQLRVLAPKALAHQFKDTHGIVYGTTATFGAPYYGETVLGQLLYSESKGKAHCEHGDYSMPDLPTRSPKKADNSPHQEVAKVLLVQRGRCTFVTKVRIAQEKGAQAVVVVDRESSTATVEDIQNVIMSDDGWGDSVQIPSILVSKSEGHLLIDAAKHGTVMVELSWDIPRAQVVLMDFWMSSGDRLAVKFLEKFQPYALALGQHLQFAPRFNIFTPDKGLQGVDESQLCVIEGSESFCAMDPDGGGPVTGEDVVNEDVRQLCLWNTTARREPSTGATVSSEYWQYIADFPRRCSLRASKAKDRFGKVCSQLVMQSLHVDTSLVQQCVEKNRLVLLRDQLKNLAWSHVALRLNGWRYSGPLDPQTVMQAVCGGYTAPPDECSSLRSGAAPGEVFTSGASSLGSLFVAILGLAVMLLAACFFYKRHLTFTVRRLLREEVMLEVQSQMADYVVMDEDGQHHPGQHHPANNRVLSF